MFLSYSIHLMYRNLTIAKVQKKSQWIEVNWKKTWTLNYSTKFNWNLMLYSHLWIHWSMQFNGGFRKYLKISAMKIHLCSININMLQNHIKNSRCPINFVKGVNSHATVQHAIIIIINFIWNESYWNHIQYNKTWRWSQ